MEQGSVLPTLIDCPFRDAICAVFILKRLDVSLFNLARREPRGKKQKTEVLIEELPFADDASTVSTVAYSGATLQTLINNVARAYDLFSLML